MLISAQKDLPYLQFCYLMIEPGDFNILFAVFVIMPYNPIQYPCFSFSWIAYFKNLQLINKREVI